MAKRQSAPAKETFSREALERHRASGLSVREFCHREQLGRICSTLAADDRGAGWSVAATKRRPAPSPAFAHVVATAAAPCDSSVVVELGAVACSDSPARRRRRSWRT